MRPLDRKKWIHEADKKNQNMGLDVFVTIIVVVEIVVIKMSTKLQLKCNKSHEYLVKSICCFIRINLF